MNITTADLPWSDMEQFSVEALLTWASSALQEVTRSTFLDEGDGEQTPRISSSPFQVIINGAQKDAMVHRIVLLMQDDWRTGGKVWTSIEDLTTSALPESYKSN